MKFKSTSKFLFISTISISLFITFLNFNPLTRELVNPLIDNNPLIRELANPLIINRAYAVEPTQIQLDQTASILNSIQSIINKLKTDIQALFGREVKAQADITTGLVGHWKFDEGAGTAAADSSGNNNTGTLTNGPAWTTGKIGGALSFDGVDDFVNVNDSASIGIAGAVTISTWVNFKTLPTGNDGIISKGTTDSSLSYVLYTEFSDGPYKQVKFFVSTNGYKGPYYGKEIIAGNVIKANTWQHITAVYNPSTSMRIYIDGVMIMEDTVGIPANMYNANFPIRIGQGPFSSPDASFDDVRVYNRVLTQTEITELYNLGSGTPPPSDTTPPVLSSGSPIGTLPAGTTQTTLSLATNENATCKYGTTPNTAYASITNTFTTTGGTTHSQTITGLTNGTSYNYYIRCQDTAGNLNTTDYIISFSVASPPPPAGDTTPPTVSITSPTSGQTVSGTIIISASATDNVAVAGAQFKLDTTTNLGAEDTTSPYSYSLNTATITNGSHTLTAIARDTSNNYTTSSIITITVNNASPPPPDITSPSTPTGLTATAISSSQINLSWTASTDNVGVAGYKIYRCLGSTCAPTVQIATSATNSYSDTGLTASTAYTYAVSAYDAAGNESGKSMSVSATTFAVSSQTALATLAASMQPGTWVEMNTGLTKSFIETDASDGRGPAPILQYADSATWDPTSRQVLFLGSPHYRPYKFIIYSEADNSWRLGPLPFPENTLIHGYDHNTINPAIGIVYFRQYNSSNVYQYDIATNTWSQLPSIPGHTEGAGGLKYFPEMNGLVFISGDGNVYFFNLTTKQWTTLAQSLPLPQYEKILGFCFP